MKNEINLLPKKSKEELQIESRAYTLDIIAAVVIVLVEIAMVIIIGDLKNVSLQKQNAYKTYQTDSHNIGKFKNTIATINNINQRYSNIKLIQNSFPNPINVLQKFEALAPSNIVFSNFSYNYLGNITFTAQSNHVLNVADLIQVFTSANPKDKYFTNTQIQSVGITYNPDGTKNVNFSLSTQYINK